MALINNSSVTRVALDGSTVKMLFGRAEIPAQKASYGDGIEVADTTPMGMQGIGATTPGMYKRDALKVTFEATYFRAEVLARYPQFAIAGIPMTIVIAYGHAATGYDSDQLDNCRLIKIGAQVESSNKAFEIETEWTFTQLRWTTRRVMINNPLGLPVVTVGNSGF